MTVTSVHKDPDALTMAITVELDATVERAWQLWSDPRQLERWWGPPGYPATFVDHDLTVGSRVTYFMTSPEGEKYHGLWKVTAVDPPRSLEFVDSFADESGNPKDDMPSTTTRMELTERDGGTRMELRSKFDSREQMDELEKMGMIEGIREAVGQIDALLAE